MLEEVPVACPFCGESVTVLVDCSAGDQTYVEDCFVCCQPMLLRVHVGPDGELLDVAAAAEND